MIQMSTDSETAVATGVQFPKSIFDTTLNLTESKLLLLSKRMNEGQPGELNLSSTSLTDVPIKDFKGVQTLDLSNNKLTSIDGVFSHFYPRMDYLDLSHNLITSLPLDIGDKLINLSHLDLHDNKITQLPLSLARMERLHWVDIRKNTLNSSLAFICGNCETDTECRACAVSIRHFLATVQGHLLSPVIHDVDEHKARSLEFGSRNISVLSPPDFKISDDLKEKGMFDGMQYWLMGSSWFKWLLITTIISIMAPLALTMCFDESYMKSLLLNIPHLGQSLAEYYLPKHEALLNIITLGGNIKGFPLVRNYEAEPVALSWFKSILPW